MPGGSGRRARYINFRLNQMEMSSTAPSSKRPYRMSARAQAAAETGERLLASAYRHFTTRPYEEVRLQEIAADAGVTVQPLAKRFGSKDELLSAAYQWWGAAETLRRDAAPVGDVAGAVRNVF